MGYRIISHSAKDANRSPLTTNERIIVQSRQQLHNPTIDCNGLHPEQHSIFDTAVFAAVFGPPKICLSAYMHAKQAHITYGRCSKGNTKIDNQITQQTNRHTHERR